MKRFTLTIVLMLVACFTAQAQISKKLPDTRKIEQELMQLERDWAAASLKHDVAAINRILADDYIGIDGRGFVSDKAQEIEETKPLAPGAAIPDRVVLDDQVSDMRVRVYGNTAVVTGISNEKIRFKENESMVRYRRTTVYVKRQNGWQCVSFHGSRIIEPSK